MKQKAGTGSESPPTHKGQVYKAQLAGDFKITYNPAPPGAPERDQTRPESPPGSFQTTPRAGGQQKALESKTAMILTETQQVIADAARALAQERIRSRSLQFEADSSYPPALLKDSCSDIQRMVIARSL